MDVEWKWSLIATWTIKKQLQGCFAAFTRLISLEYLLNLDSCHSNVVLSTTMMHPENFLDVAPAMPSPSPLIPVLEVAMEVLSRLELLSVLSWMLHLTPLARMSSCRCNRLCHCHPSMISRHTPFGRTCNRGHSTGGCLGLCNHNSRRWRCIRTAWRWAWRLLWKIWKLYPRGRMLRLPWNSKISGFLFLSISVLFLPLIFELTNHFLTNCRSNVSQEIFVKHKRIFVR